MVDLRTTYMGIPLRNPSHESDYRLPLRYAGLLEGTIHADICSSTGICTGEAIAKMILAGATTVQTVSSLLRHKRTHIRTLLRDLETWMELKGYPNLSSFRGKLSRRHSADPWAYTRDQYVKMMMGHQNILSKPSGRRD